MTTQAQRRLKIGITCYPTYGGSGVIASEVGKGMASRGHEIHFITYDLPRRLERFQENIYFHQVEAFEYPLFAHSNYPINLASQMADVSLAHHLDILHVHYAIPHATSAYLAKQVLGKDAPKLITTLHGTDITLVGHQRSYLSITRFSILQSDLITVPSTYLREATYEKLGIDRSVQMSVIPNFVDTNLFSPVATAGTRALSRTLGLCRRAERIVTHISNFRPVKRIEDVVRMFSLIQQQVPCHLLMVGDGPERSRAEALVRELKLSEKVCFLGKQESVEEILKNSDVFLLPSESESFGLAALEAMSCGVPVIASNSGGLSELVVDGETGFLSPVGDFTKMANDAIRLLSDETLLCRFGAQARDRATSQFGKERLIDEYENAYFSLLGLPQSSPY